MNSCLLPRRALLSLFAVLCLPLAALKAQPVITLASSAYSVELGGTVRINGVTVNGQTPLTYQWVEQGANSTTVTLQDGATANGSTLSGTATLALTLTGATAADAGAYAIQVTDANGASTTSAWITLTVKAAAPPTITSQPANQTIVAGNNAWFQISATGSYPRTYQWYKGAVGSGTVIAGATSNPLLLPGALAADAGSYYVTVANAYGNATSTAATLTVNPATPITYSGSGTAQTAYVGQSLTLYMYAYGSTPITYQWQKNGVNIPGATSSSYILNPVALGDAGTYTQVATNAAGSATSPAITLTVNPAVPVTFPATANPVTITAGQSLSLYMNASGGSSPITYQWQKDGTALSGATGSSYYKSLTTTADSGNYTVVGTNPAGSTTSPAIQVTVNPPVPPTITTPPADVSVSQGNSAQFSVVAAGTYPFTFQWLKDGTAISGATYSSYSISTTQAADAGAYSVTVSNAAGHVTSAAATLTVLPPLAPSFSFSVTQQSVAVGANLTLSAPSLYNYSNNGPVGPYTYQWFKDGSAISGAVGSTYTLSTAQLTDAGTYAVAVTNAGGTVAAPPTEVAVTPAAGSGSAWIDAAQQGSIIYFLFASHIERYDLAAGAWLPSTSVSQTATAFCVAADGVYVGFGRALAKFPLDLSSQTTLANLGGSITGLFSAGNFIYAAANTSYSSPTLYPVDRNSGTVGAAALSSVQSNDGFSVLSTSKIYVPGTYSELLTVDASGSVTSQSINYYNWASSSRGYLLPDQQHFADNGGTVFSVSDGSFAGTFGAAFTDMAFLADGTPVVLRNNVLYTYAVGGMKETAHLALSTSGSRVFASGGNVFVFYPGSSTGNSYVGLTEVAGSAITSGYTVAPAADASHLSFAAGATLQDAAGTMYLYDAAHENLFRWSPSAQAYLSPIPLGGAPVQFLYSATLNAIYCEYSTGRVTKIDLTASAPAEQPFSTFPLRVLTATGADNFLFAVLQHARDSGEVECTIDGQTGAIADFSGYTYFGRNYAWSHANQTLYSSQAQYSTGSGLVQPLSSTGKLLLPPFQLTGGTGNTFPSPDGSRLLAGGGQMYDATGLNIGTLGNSVSDVAWLGGMPYTMRTNAVGGTEIQLWSPTKLILTAAAELPGTPVRLVAIAGSQLLAVTENSGVPTYTVLNTSLQRVSTTASGSPSTGAPTFVTQPAPSLSVFSGTNVTLGVDTNGATPQTFQWYKNSAAIGGATGTTLTLSAVSSADAANYYVVATNTSGSATSTTTSLSVAPALTFTTQPQSQVMASGSATFTAAVANDTGASYQWYFNRSAVSGATSNTLVVSPISSSNWGTYILKVSNAAGAVYSNAVTLLPPAPTITTQPQSLALTTGSSGSLSVSAQYATSYQWYQNGNLITGATSSYYWLNSVTAAAAGSYTCVVTGQGGTTTSAAATVTVGAAAPPAITTQPQSMRVDPGTNVTLTVSGTNVTSFQWYFNGVAISGATSSLLSIPAATSANSGNYTVKLTGPGGSVTSNAATLTVAYLAPVITQQPQSIVAPAGSNVQFLCSGANIHSMQWYFNGTAISGAINPWLNLSGITAANVGNYSVVLTGPGGDTVTSNTVTLSLGGTAVPAITTQPQSVVGAAGGSVTLSVVGTNVTSYQWYFNGVALAGATNASLVLNNLSAANAGNYTVVLAGPGGTVTSNVATVNVSSSQTPVIGTQPQSVSDVTGTLVLLSVAATNATSYQWYFNGVAIPGATATTYTLELSTQNAGTYTVAVTGPGGTTISTAATVTALPNAYAGTYFGTSTGGASWALWVPRFGRAKFVSFMSQTSVAQAGELKVTSAGAFSVTSLSGWAKIYTNPAYPSAITGTIAGGVVTGTMNNGGGNMSGTLDTGTTEAAFAGYYASAALNGAYGQAYAITGGSGQTLVIWVNLQSVGAQPDSATGTLTGDPQFTGTTALGRAVTVAIDANTGTMTQTLAATGMTTVTFGGVSATATNTARLLNLSSRAQVGTGADVLVTGFSLAGTGSKQILVRGVGPTLKDFGITNALPTPEVDFTDGNSNTLWTGTSWGGSSTLSDEFNAVGAFALPADSADAAHIFQSAVGRYTAVVKGAGGATGIAMAEIYDADANASGVRLVNVSARGNVQPGAGVLTAGLVIGGNGPETVLLRGVGPTLKDFSISDYLPTPQLSLYDQAGHLIASNSKWDSTSGLISFAASQVGAFALPAGSADTALLVTLMPGNYSVQVTGQNGATGVALVEVYEVKTSSP